MALVTKRAIAVIGGGYWGQNLIRVFAELGALRTVCDSNPETIARLKQQYPDIDVETDFKRVLADKDITALVIATPAASHYTIARQALKAGKDVFVEKPLALNPKDGEEMVRLADEHNRLLMVGHLLEYHPAVVKLKEMVDSGELGNINYIYSSRLNLGKFRSEENVLWSFAPHDISVILLLLGEEMPEEITAHGSYYLHRNVADVTVTTMSFGSGANAHIFVSWLHPYKEQKLIVIGDKKMAVFDDVTSNNKLLLYEHQIEWIERQPIPHKEEAVPVPFTMEEPLKLECRYFLDCCASRREPRTNGTRALAVLRVLDACQKSLQGKGISVSIAGKDYYIHPTSLVEEPANIGAGTRIWHYSHVMPDVTIGKNCNIGQNVFIGNGVSIGSNVKIQNNVSVFEGVTLEDNVFCGPSCVFTNVNTPRSHTPQHGKYAKTLVKKGATIGANATVVCGHTVGEYAFIGAGAVVTDDIPDYALVYGNPARIQGWRCRCNDKLSFNSDGKAACPSCDKKYTRQGSGKKTVVKKVGR